MKKILICLAALSLACPGYSQDEKKTPEDTKLYKLDFVVKEIEGGRLVNSRSYSMSVSASNNNNSIRTGDKVPTPTNKDGGFTYVDVGVGIDCRILREVDGQLVLQVSADISGVASPGNPGPSVINQTRWTAAAAAVPLRKATTLFAADGATGKRQMQLEVTATPTR